MKSKQSAIRKEKSGMGELERAKIALDNAEDQKMVRIGEDYMSVSIFELIGRFSAGVIDQYLVEFKRKQKRRRIIISIVVVAILIIVGIVYFIDI